MMMLLVVVMRRMIDAEQRVMIKSRLSQKLICALSLCNHKIWARVCL